MNISSTPMPIRMNGSTLTTGLRGTKSVVKPYATITAKPTLRIPEKARRARECVGLCLVNTIVAYTKIIRYAMLIAARSAEIDLESSRDVAPSVFGNTSTMLLVHTVTPSEALPSESSASVHSSPTIQFSCSSQALAALSPCESRAWSCSRNVSLESRYGTCFSPRARVLRTLPRAESDLLIACASLSVAPDASVLESRSEPARSTRESLPTYWSPLLVIRVRTVSVTTMCERDETSLRPVDATARFLSPCTSSVFACDAVCVCSDVRSLTYMPTSWSRMMSYFNLDTSALGSRSRSRMFSL
mmetsp:Transcript_36777/g.97192  ORF Transcript_36777/g.97192 Transcript_36777/m.97192 type:complete len:302 (+) Transcript_36777:2507-3412(+)